MIFSYFVMFYFSLLKLHQRESANRTFAIKTKTLWRLHLQQSVGALEDAIAALLNTINMIHVKSVRLVC